jgi:serine/threonine protein kinase
MGLLSKLFGQKKDKEPAPEQPSTPLLPAAKPSIPPSSPGASPPRPSPPPKAAESQRTSFYAPGSLIADRYEVASRPLMGGMGIGYLCMDREEDRPVALKTFKPEYLPDRAARDRFLREGTTWIDLGYPVNIVRCYQVRYFDPTAFLALDLVAKEQNKPDASLRSWLIPVSPLAMAEALLFALQIARGMQYAVQTLPGFVHRDLKPENVLVGADKLPGTNINRLRVTDFGLVSILQAGNALAIGGDSDPTVIDLAPREDSMRNPMSRTQLTHEIAGPPLYMAPEQWKGEVVGVFTDVYAVGCILYEMLSGQWAVEGRILSELQASHCAGKLRPLPGSLPGDVAGLVQRCLALDPCQRYGTWEELTRQLEKVYEAHSG